MPAYSPSIADYSVNSTTCSWRSQHLITPHGKAGLSRPGVSMTAGFASRSVSRRLGTVLIPSSTNDTAMENKGDLQHAVDKLKELVSVGDVCMFTTLDNNSKVTTRPMTTAGIDPEANLWFFTNEFSETIHEVSGDSLVHLMYANPSKNKYVHVRGNCIVVINREKARELWSPFMSAWFPQGLDDPKLCLVKVMTGEADFWNNSSSKVVVGFNILKAMVTGEKYNEGEKGKLTLS